MKTVIQDILNLIKGNIPFAVATILSHSGSTPRTAGTKMLILADGTIRGTIGGGLVEAQVIKKGQELIGLKKNVLLDFNLNQDLKESLDMICGGAITVFIDTTAGEQIGLYQKIAQEMGDRKRCMLVSELSGTKDGTLALNQCLITDSFGVIGKNLVPESFSDDLLKTHFTKNAPVITTFGNRKITYEPIPATGTVFIFGAGHVSQKVAELTALLDLPTVIIDDRKEFANGERFNRAEGIHVIDDFSDPFGTLDVTPSSFIIILTRGHLHDQTVLRGALKTPARYIGMIGSKQKRDRIYDNLMEEGISGTRLKTVYSPIGMEILAETPAEIAVSIVSELIAVKNRK
ncbi:MAG: XdhC family protein [Desulfobacterium sp.]|nr:XdhC family protein [Desulfobacterium sp.]